MRDFTAGRFYVIPETPRALIAKPSCLTWRKEKRKKQKFLQAFIVLVKVFVNQKLLLSDINGALIGLNFI